MKNLKKVNLFVVGAAKSGTTALYHFLNLHPEIFLSPIKEPHYFSKDIRFSKFSDNYRNRNYFDLEKYFAKEVLEFKQIAFIEDSKHYESLFKNSSSEKYLGEVSNGYLISKKAYKEIYKYNKNSKIIMILRNPLERAFSHWRQEFRAGFSHSDNFYDDIVKDYNLNDWQWGGISNTYVQLGLYSEQIKKYFDLFPKENIKVFLYDDLINNPKKLRKDLFNFLNVSDFEVDFSKRHNSDFEGKNFIINQLFKFYRKHDYYLKHFTPNPIKIRLKKLLFRNKKAFNTISNEEKNKLIDYFSDDITKTAKLLNRDLSHWIFSKN